MVSENSLNLFVHTRIKSNLPHKFGPRDKLWRYFATLYSLLALKIARFPRAFILWPASIAFILSYPSLYALFLSCDSSVIVGTDSSVPSVLPVLPGSHLVGPDLVFKQLWIQSTNQSSSSSVLDKSFLVQLSSLQSSLLQNITICYPSDNPSSHYVKDCYGYLRSPLFYWNNSLDSLLKDDKILRTINSKPDNKNSVMAGIKIISGKIRSAEALKLSFFYKPSTNAGEIWDNNLKLLMKNKNSTYPDNFKIYTNPPEIKKTRAFAYHVNPLSYSDHIILMVSYSLIALYFLISLSNIHSVKSRFGLLVTFTVEMILAVMCAATVTSYIFRNTNLLNIPLQVLPFVVIVVGIENMFRLVNAVSLTPGEKSISLRLSLSFQQIGFKSTLVVLTDIIILMILYPFANLQTKQFCIFATIALIVDHILHLTYFAAVLSVDIRRLELEDLLRSSEFDSTNNNSNNSITVIDNNGNDNSNNNNHNHHNHNNSNNINLIIKENKRLYNKQSLSTHALLFSSNNSSGNRSSTSSSLLNHLLGQILMKIKMPFTTSILGSLTMIAFLILINFKYLESSGSGSNSRFNNLWNHDDSVNNLSNLDSSSSSTDIIGNSIPTTNFNDFNEFNEFPFFLGGQPLGLNALLYPNISTNIKKKKFKIIASVEEPTVIIISQSLNKSQNDSSSAVTKPPVIDFALSTTYHFDTYYILEFLASLVFILSLTSVILKCILPTSTDDDDDDLNDQNIVLKNNSLNGSHNVTTHGGLIIQNESFESKDLISYHKLDIFKIVTTIGCRFIVSVGMDHRVLVWSPLGKQIHQNNDDDDNFNTIPPPVSLQLSHQFWPVTHVVLGYNNNCNYIAIFSKNGSIMCWSRRLMQYIWTINNPELVNTIPLEAFFRKKTMSAFMKRKMMANKANSNFDENQMRKRGDSISSEKSISRRSSLNSIRLNANGIGRNSGLNSPRLGPVDLSDFSNWDGINEDDQNEVELVIILKNGSIIILNCNDGSIIQHDKLVSTVFNNKSILNNSLIWAKRLITPRVSDRIVACNDNGDIIVSTVINNKWKSRILTLHESYNQPNYQSQSQIQNNTSNTNNSTTVGGYNRVGSVGMNRKINLSGRSQVSVPSPLSPSSTSPQKSQTMLRSSSSSSTKTTKNEYKNSFISLVSFVGMFVRTKDLTAELIDVQSGIVLKKFQVGQIKPGSFRVFHAQPTHCRFCGCAAVASFSIAYTELESRMLILHTYTIDNRAKTNICLRVERDPREKRCLGFEAVTEHQHWLSNVDCWSVTGMNILMGVRKKNINENNDDMVYTEQLQNSSTGIFSHNNNNTNGIRNRRKRNMRSTNNEFEQSSSSSQIGTGGLWEGWTMTPKGKVTYYDIPSSPLSSSSGLLIKKIGPIANFGHKSIIVAFGNIMKVLYLGNEDLIDQDDGEINNDDEGDNKNKNNKLNNGGANGNENVNKGLIFAVNRRKKNLRKVDIGDIGIDLSI